MIECKEKKRSKLVMHGVPEYVLLLTSVIATMLALRIVIHPEPSIDIHTSGIFGLSVVVIFTSAMKLLWYSLYPTISHYAPTKTTGS